jgi:hypothetical protein
MDKEKFHTSLYIPRAFWCKTKALASQQEKTANTLVLETLREKFENVEVKIFGK